MKKIVISALLLFAIGIGGIMYTLRLTGVNQFHTVAHKQLESDQPLRTISIDSPETDIIVKPSDQEDVTADLKVSKESRGKLYQVEISEENGQLKVNVTRKDPYVFNIGVLFYRERVEVSLPRKVYEAIRITSKAADIKIENIESNITVVRNQTGDIRLSGMEFAGDVRLDTMKGDVNVEFVLFPESMKVDFKSETGKGEAALSDIHYREKNDQRLLGQSGTGEHVLHVTTTSGGFHLFKMKEGGN